jgi:MFS family permease
MHRSKLAPWIGFAAAAAGALLFPLDFAVNVGLPNIADAFALSLEEVRWVVIAYVLTYGSLMLVCGKIGDLFGHRLAFRLGLAASIIGLAACALAPTYPALIAARMVQGLGIALSFGCSLALATLLFEESRRTSINALFQMVFYLGAALAPLLGGILIEMWGWTSLFWFRVPIAVLALLVSGELPAPGAPGRGHPIDWPGAALLIASMVCVMLSLTAVKWSSLDAAPGNAALLIVTLASMAGFVAWEARFPDPIVPLVVFREVTFTGQQLASLVTYFFGFSVWLLVPFFLARIAQFPSWQQGAVLAAAGLGSAAGIALFRAFATAAAATRWAFAGIAVCALGLGLISLWTPAWDGWWLGATLLVQGVGIGMFQVAYTDYVTAAMLREHRGVAGSLIGVTRTLGVMGSAAALSVFALIERGRVAAGASPEAAFQTAFRAVFACAALGLLAALVVSLSRPAIWFPGEGHAGN